MAQTQIHARREAVQPSLWDRLVDDLPGLVSDSNLRRREIGAEIGPDRLEDLLAGGPRALDQATDIDERLRREIALLMQMLARRSFIEERGIVVTADILREAVRRDLEELFGTERLQARFLFGEAEGAGSEDTQDLLADFPQVRRSVLNYGVPAFSGRRAKDFDAEVLARELREVVAVYEPRFRRDTLRITVDTTDKAGLKIRLEGVLMMAPVPERLALSTLVDLDGGRSVTRIEEA